MIIERILKNENKLMVFDIAYNDISEYINSTFCFPGGSLLKIIPL